MAAPTGISAVAPSLIGLATEAATYNPALFWAVLLGGIGLAGRVLGFVGLVLGLVFTICQAVLGLFLLVFGVPLRLAGALTSRRTGRRAGKPSTGDPALRARNASLGGPFDADHGHVLDGDTVEVHVASGPVRLRIWGIDAPELKQAGGRQARNQLARLLGSGRLQVIPVDIDVYGRLVARVRQNGDDIGGQMVASGHARADRRASPAYAAIEDSARSRRSGLWSFGDIEDPALFRKMAAD